MKRTISECIDLIKQKKESAEQERKKAYNSNMPFMDKFAEVEKFIGYDEAYTDVLSLLETSHLIEQEKALEILKKHITCKKYNVSTEPDIDEYEYYIVPKNPTTRLELTKENYDLLSEILKDNE